VGRNTSLKEIIMTWVRDDSAGYGNLDKAFSVVSTEVTPGVWALRAFVNQGVSYSFQLAGTWSTQAAALEVLRKITDAVDPSTY
jgi:hypothetical protein